MNRFLKSTILTMAVAATTFAALPAANAGDGWRHHGQRHVRHGGSDGDLLAAGILGLAVGALVVGAAASAEPDYYEPVYARPHRQPRPSPERNYYPAEPEVVYLDGAADAGAEPWSAEWRRYCENRYRSFDARSGTFTGYDGDQHFCVAD